MTPSAPALLHKPLGDHNCGLAWLLAEVTTVAAWQGAVSTVDSLLWETESSQGPHVSEQVLGSVQGGSAGSLSEAGAGAGIQGCTR